jgi:pimeloyl-ACP methyl ester carboxylesterase
MPDLIKDAPAPKGIVSPDGTTIATYDFGDPEAPVVLAVHGFASSALVNWHHTGWTRDLTRNGFRVIAMDQRGHGLSDRPHTPDGYSMELLVGDVLSVLDTLLLDEVSYVGYSLGARVGWQAALTLPHRISRAVLGGIPDGLPLTRFRVDLARDHIATGAPVHDRLTEAYLTMAGRTAGNDLSALVDLVEGMADAPQPELGNPPLQPILFATGSEDKILPASKALAEATPHGTFFEIPGRNHFNAPTSRHFRDAAVAFLCEPQDPDRASEV